MTDVVVVGVDGSEGSKTALRFAAGEAALRDAMLRIVCAWHVSPAVYAGFGAPPVDAGAGFEERAKNTAADALAEAGRLQPGIDREARTPEGQAAEMLVDESVGAELLVVGSRGRGGFRSLLLGSVSQQVAHHAGCPVAIVPQSRVPGDAADASEETPGSSARP